MRWWPRWRTGLCPGCEHIAEAPGCLCPRGDCVCRAARRARFDAVIVTLSPRDRTWVLSSREQLVRIFDAAAREAGVEPSTDLSIATRGDLQSVFAALDVGRLRQIFAHQLAEADDPAAVERVWQLMMQPTADPRFDPT